MMIDGMKLKRKRRRAALLSNWRLLLTFLNLYVLISISSLFCPLNNLTYKITKRTALATMVNFGTINSTVKVTTSITDNNFARKLVGLVCALYYSTDSCRTLG